MIAILSASLSTRDDTSRGDNLLILGFELNRVARSGQPGDDVARWDVYSKTCTALLTLLILVPTVLSKFQILEKPGTFIRFQVKIWDARKSKLYPSIPSETTILQSFNFYFDIFLGGKKNTCVFLQNKAQKIRSVQRGKNSLEQLIIHRSISPLLLTREHVNLSSLHLSVKGERRSLARINSSPSVIGGSISER